MKKLEILNFLSLLLTSFNDYKNSIKSSINMLGVSVLYYYKNFANLLAIYYNLYYILTIIISYIITLIFLKYYNFCPYDVYCGEKSETEKILELHRKGYSINVLRYNKLFVVDENNKTTWVGFPNWESERERILNEYKINQKTFIPNDGNNKFFPYLMKEEEILQKLSSNYDIKANPYKFYSLLPIEKNTFAMKTPMLYVTPQFYYKNYDVCDKYVEDIIRRVLSEVDFASVKDVKDLQTNNIRKKILEALVTDPNKNNWIAKVYNKDVIGNLVFEIITRRGYSYSEKIYKELISIIGTSVLLINFCEQKAMNPFLLTDTHFYKIFYDIVKNFKLR